MAEEEGLERVVIQTVAFEPDGGVQIAYYTPRTDVTTVGVINAHTLVVPAGYDYDDEIQAVLDAVEHLVLDVMDDWKRLPKVGDPVGEPPP